MMTSYYRRHDDRSLWRHLPRKYTKLGDSRHWLSRLVERAIASSSGVESRRQ